MRRRAIPLNRLSEQQLRRNFDDPRVNVPDVITSFLESGPVKLTMSHAEAMSFDGCQTTGYGLGKSGWVSLPISSASVETICDFVEEIYRNIAPKKLSAQIAN
jgi:hypothetical protein